MYISIGRNIHSQLSIYREMYFSDVLLKKSILEIIRNTFYNRYCNFII